MCILCPNEAEIKTYTYNTYSKIHVYMYVLSITANLAPVRVKGKLQEGLEFGIKFGE
jgi:hypothetical protein